MGTSSPRDASWEVDQQIADRVLACMPRDMTQTALSKATGIPESTLSRYLHPREATGRIRGTPAAALLSIARALGVTICELYGVDEGLSHIRPKHTNERSSDNVLIISDRDNREVGRIDAERLNGLAELLTAVVQGTFGPTTGAETRLDALGTASPGGVPFIAEAKRYDDPMDRPAADFELGQSAESEGFTPSQADRDTRAALEVLDSLTEEQRAGWLAAGRAIRRERGGAG